MTQALSSPTIEQTVTQFPRAILSVSREELDNIPLIVKAGLSEQTVELPLDLEGYVFILGPAGTLDSPTDPLRPSVVLPAQDGFTPLYNGDGMVYRLAFGQGQAHLKTKIAASIDGIADRITHPDPTYADLKFHNYGITRGSLNLGVCTQLSVTLTPFRFQDNAPYRLLLTVDMGRPFELDPQTLDILRPIGLNRDWKSVNSLFPQLAFPLVMSSAHPSFDFVQKELFTVNLGKSISHFLPSVRQVFNHVPFLHTLIQKSQTRWKPSQGRLLDPWIHQIQQWLGAFITAFIGLGHRSGLWDRLVQFLQWVFKGLTHNDFVDLMRWSESGQLDRWQVVLENGQPLTIQQTLHQMWATKNHIVLLDTAFKISLEELLPYERGALTEATEKLFRDLTDVAQLADTPVYIIRRADLQPGQSQVKAKQVTINPPRHCPLCRGL